MEIRFFRNHAYPANTPLFSSSLEFEFEQQTPNSIRVRINDIKAYITIKGKTVGASRPEFEYEIPMADAEELISQFCSNVIEKTRHFIIHDNKTWEVDEFKGMNEGLIVAEIELAGEDEKYSLPNWVEKNVTNDPRYANSNLSTRPFMSWK